ncbi:MAG: DUF4330 family protein [Candidatus Omnitrophica bacterium]|nr:DUF4330 family protein [Candidatus Omnitrophota bacterium]
MKIIDERGRIFGKINIIDLFVILFLLLVISPVAYYSYNALSKKPEPKKVMPEAAKVFQEIEVDGKFIGITAGDLELISVGSQQLDKRGDVAAEVLALGKVSDYKTYEYKFELGGGQRIIKEAIGLKQLDARLKLKAEVEGHKLHYNGQRIKVGLPLRFKTNGKVYDFLPMPLEEKIRMQVKYTLLLAELCDFIKVGDVHEEMTQELNKIVNARLINVVFSEPSKLLRNSYDGKDYILQEQPQYRDMILEFEVLCERNNYGLFPRYSLENNTENKPLKLGNTYTFSTDLYALYNGKIIDIEIIE